MPLVSAASRSPSRGLRQTLTVYRAIYSNRQLQEELADFWFNHFNVYEAKGQLAPILFT
jgi:hypothetical protein